MTTSSLQSDSPTPQAEPHPVPMGADASARVGLADHKSDKVASTDKTYLLVASILLLASLAFVTLRAWMTDDAYITFRHVANLHAGFGPVFNPGERVQGFSHPLWFLLLTAGNFAFNLSAVANGISLLFTAGLVVLMAVLFRRLPQRDYALIGMLVLLLSSRSFVEFQTSGLETSLVNLLMAAACGLLATAAVEGRRFPAVGAAWLCSLLMLTRPDTAIFCAPILLGILVSLIRRRSRRVWIGAAAAALPLIAWYGFATIYYGTPLPNTAYAKVVFSTHTALHKGLVYTLDYAAHEPVQAAFIAIVLAVGLVRSLRNLRASKTDGATLLYATLAVCFHLAYIFRIGGDFMHGRLFSPPLVSAVVLAPFIFVGFLRKYPVGRGLTLVLFAAGVLLCLLVPPKGEFLAGLMRMASFYREVLAPSILSIIMAAILGTVTLILVGRHLARRGASMTAFAATILAGAFITLALTSYHRPPLILVGLYTGIFTLCASAIGLSIRGRGFRSPASLAVLGMLLAALISQCDFDPRVGNINWHTGIADEYSWYAPVHWSNPFVHRPPDRLYPVRELALIGQRARQYAERHGPITLIGGVMGFFSFYAGPSVHVLDLYGLTDPFIARGGAPANSRIGHIDYEIPEDYLRCRGALNLLPDWLSRLRQDDPTLIEQARQMQAHAAWVRPEEAERWRKIHTIIAGPLLSRDRLALIPWYILPRHHLIPPWPHQQMPINRFILTIEGELWDPALELEPGYPSVHPHARGGITPQAPTYPSVSGSTPSAWEQCH